MGDGNIHIDVKASNLLASKLLLHAQNANAAVINNIPSRVQTFSMPGVERLEEFTPGTKLPDGAIRILKKAHIALQYKSTRAWKSALLSDLIDPNSFELIAQRKDIAQNTNLRMHDIISHLFSQEEVREASYRHMRSILESDISPISKWNLCCGNFDALEFLHLHEQHELVQLAITTASIILMYLSPRTRTSGARNVPLLQRGGKISESPSEARTTADEPRAAHYPQKNAGHKLYA